MNDSGSSAAEHLIGHVEVRAEQDARAGKPPNAQEAIREAIEIIAGPSNEEASTVTYLKENTAAKQEPTPHEREVMAERYGLIYGAKRADPEQKVAALVRRWRGL